MSLAAFAAFAATFALFVAAPGPGVAALVARALGSGFAATAPMIAGYVIGDLIYFALAIFGLAVVAAKFALVFTAIKYAGAVYLVWLAWAFWTARVDAADAAALQARRAEGARRLFLAGLSVTLGNPKVIIFYLALLPNFVDLAHLTPAAMVAYGLVITTVLSGVLAAYAALAAKARALFASHLARRLLNRAAATVMAGAAAALVAK